MQEIQCIVCDVVRHAAALRSDAFQLSSVVRPVVCVLLTCCMHVVVVWIFGVIPVFDGGDEVSKCRRRDLDT